MGPALESCEVELNDITTALRPVYPQHGFANEAHGQLPQVEERHGPYNFWPDNCGIVVNPYSYPQRGITNDKHRYHIEASNPPRELSPSRTGMVPLPPRWYGPPPGYPYPVPGLFPERDLLNNEGFRPCVNDGQRQHAMVATTIERFNDNNGAHLEGLVDPSRQYQAQYKDFCSSRGGLEDSKQQEDFGNPQTSQFIRRVNDITVAKMRNNDHNWSSTGYRKDTPIPSLLRVGSESLRGSSAHQSISSPFAYRGQSNPSSRQTSLESRAVSIGYSTDARVIVTRITQSSRRRSIADQQRHAIPFRPSTNHPRTHRNSEIRGSEMSNDWRKSSQSKLFQTTSTS